VEISGRKKVTIAIKNTAIAIKNEAHSSLTNIEFDEFAAKYLP
jgi:hypothetical protein